MKIFDPKLGQNIEDNTLGVSDDVASRYVRVTQDPNTGLWWGVTHDGVAEVVRSMMSTTVRPTEMERFGKGATDITSGVKQAYLFHTDPEEYGRYTKAREEDLEYYNRALDEYTGGGIDWFGLGGEAGMVAPLGMANVGRTWIGRGISSAAQGGAAGAMMFTPNEGGRVVNAVAGTVGGAAALPIGAGLKRVAAGGTAAASRALNQLRSAVIPDSQLSVRIQNQFPDLGGLSAPTRDKVMAEARRQLEQTGDFDAASLERIARAEELGFTGDRALTTGQASRNNTLFSRERNLAKLEDGQELTARFTAQSRRLTEELRADLPRSSIARSEAGTAVIDAVNDRWDQTQSSVSKVYKMIEGRYGDATVDDGLPQFQQYLDELGDDATLSPLVDSVLRRGERIGLFGDDAKPVTVTQIESLRKFVGKLSDKNEPALKMAKREIIDALDDSVIDTFGDDVFKLARDRARERFEMFSGKLARRITEGKAEGDSLYRKILAADSADVEQIKYVLQATEEGQEAWQALRSAAIDDIWRKGAPFGADGEFRPAGFRTAIDDRIGEKKLKVLFTPEEVKRLNDIKQTAIDILVDPPFSSVNRSNTAPTLMNLMRRVPTVGGEIAGKVDDAVRASQNMVEIERATRGQGKPALTVPEVMQNIEALSQGKIGQAMAPLRTGAVVAPGLITGQGLQNRE